MWFIAGKLLLPRCKKKLTWSAEVVTKHMQVDRMFRADAAITIKQNKTKTERGGILTIKRGIVHCLIMVQRQRLINILSTVCY